MMLLRHLQDRGDDQDKLRRAKLHHPTGESLLCQGRPIISHLVALVFAPELAGEHFAPKMIGLPRWYYYIT
jgi:hypothetical protein